MPSFSVCTYRIQKKLIVSVASVEKQELEANSSLYILLCLLNFVNILTVRKFLLIFKRKRKIIVKHCQF